MSEEHHTPEQVDTAFAYAPTILRKLKNAGVRFPVFELHEDASGKLRLGDEDDKITTAQYNLAQDLLKSVRPYDMFCVRCLDGDKKHTHKVGVTFCCGLVSAAENAS